MPNLKEQAQSILLTHLLEQKALLQGNVANQYQEASPLDIAMIQHIVPDGAGQISVEQMRKNAIGILGILNSKASMILDIDEESLAQTANQLTYKEELQGHIHVHLLIGAPMNDADAIIHHVHRQFASALQSATSLIQCLNEVERLTSPEEAPAEPAPVQDARTGLACPGCSHPLSVGDRRIYIWENWQPCRGEVQTYSRIRLSRNTGVLEMMINGDSLAQWVCPECDEKNPDGYVAVAVAG
ncbi:MAG TPA: hypothetical protein V6C84_16110 [Coleofasciculaceae cyanobacterium]|jgi:hypothetical protein